MANERLQGLVYGVLLALALGWLLYLGQAVSIPIIYGILVVAVIAGLARWLERIPRVGASMSHALRYAIAVLAVALVVVVAMLQLAGNLGRVVAVLPQFQVALHGLAQDLGLRLGIESALAWAPETRGLQALAASALSSFTALTGSLILVSLYVAFLLIEQRWFPAKLANAAWRPRTPAGVRATAPRQACSNADSRRAGGEQRGRRRRLPGCGISRPGRAAWRGCCRTHRRRARSTAACRRPTAKPASRYRRC